MQKPLVAGIVAEYNPFHNGHAHMVRVLRERGADTVVCVMSGPLVQRAEAGLFSTWARAEAALAGGVDLVLRLPSPWAAASAEAFGAGGAGLLAALGCVDVLAFGAEDDDTERLCQLADGLAGEEFKQLLRAELAGGVPFARARAQAMEQLCPGAATLLATPNNILGVEYCKALRHILPPVLQAGQAAGQWGDKPLPAMPGLLAIPRLGAAHDGAPAAGIASASWLRAQYYDKGVQALAGWVPPACEEIYRQAAERGEYTSPARWEMALLARLRTKTEKDFARYEPGGDGLAARLAAAAKTAVSLEELYTLAKSKRFAHSRVRRAALAAAMELPTQRQPLPPFIQVLAAGAKGLSLLRRAKQTAILPMGASLAKLARTSNAAAETAAAEARAEDLFALCQATPAAGGRAFTHPAIFLR